MEKRAIGVFCAASETIDGIYADAARELGRWLGENGHTLVYGGAAKGLMEATAAAAKSAGGHIVGVVPDILISRNCVSTLLDEQITVHNLSERKDAIIERSDLLVALPGGIGTLDEVFHVMAGATIGYHSKLVVFYNVGGFWNGLLQQLCKYSEEGFLRGDTGKMFATVDNLEQLKKIISEK